MMGTPSCSDPTAAAVLSLVEHILQLPEGFAPALLHPHLQLLLGVLQQRIAGGRHGQVEVDREEGEEEGEEEGRVERDGTQQLQGKQQTQEDTRHPPSTQQPSYAPAPTSTPVPTNKSSTRTNTKTNTNTSVSIMQRGRGGSHRSIALRALGIVELLTQHVDVGAHGIALAMALLPVLQECARRRHAASAELTAGRTLRVLETCWRASAAADGQGGDGQHGGQHGGQPMTSTTPAAAVTTTTAAGIPPPTPPPRMSPAEIDAFLQVMAVLTGSLQERPARQALCSALDALSLRTPSLTPVATLLPQLNAWDAGSIEDMDYHARIDAYGTCREGLWGGLARLPCAILVQQCFLDLRNGNELSLRQAASAALESMVMCVAPTAVCVAPGCEGTGGGGEKRGGSGEGGGVKRGRAAGKQKQQKQQQRVGDHEEDTSPKPTTSNSTLALLLPTVVYGQIKRGLPVANLAVRQEHVLLLRRCVMVMPHAFEGLQVLVDEDVDVDFFHNIAHLQLHRFVGCVCVFVCVFVCL